MSQKISQLPAVIAANISDTDILPIVATNITSKVTVANLRTKLGTQPPLEGRTVTDSFTYLNNNRVFNVKDYGAMGDDATNDYAAIVLADSKAALVGGYVFFPMGIYRFGTTLVVQRNWIGVPTDLNGKGTILKPTAAVALAVDLQSEGCMRGIYIDGVLTTNAIGIGVGTISIANHVCLYNVQSRNFTGASGRGIKIAYCVQGWFENVYTAFNYINLHINGFGGGPTTTYFISCTFHGAVTKGVWVQNGYGTVFRSCLYDVNGEEGFYCQNTGDNIINMLLDGESWFESNWQSVGSGAPRHAKYALYVDGATGPSGTIRITIRDAYFNISATTERAMRLTNAIAYKVDNVSVFNEAANILVDGTSYGEFTNWMEQNGAFRTTVSATDYNSVAWSSRSHLEDNIETAFTDWTPALSGSGTMTINTVNVIEARYKIVGKTLKVENLNVTFTTATAGAAYVILTLPTNVRVKNANAYRLAALFDPGLLAGLVQSDGTSPTTSLKFSRIDSANWSLGASRQILFSGEFELF